MRGTDHGRLLLLGQLLQLVGLLLCFDEAFLYIIHGLQTRSIVNTTHTYAPTSKRGRRRCTHLVKEVVDGELVVVEQNLLFCGEEPLAEGEAGSWDG